MSSYKIIPDKFLTAPHLDLPAGRRRTGRSRCNQDIHKAPLISPWPGWNWRQAPGVCDILWLLLCYGPPNGHQIHPHFLDITIINHPPVITTDSWYVYHSQMAPAWILEYHLMHQISDISDPIQR